MFSIDLHEYLVDPERRYQYARHDSPLECEPQVIDMRRFPFALSIPRHGSKFPHPPFRDYRSFAKVYRFRCLAESSSRLDRFSPHIAPTPQSGFLDSRFSPYPPSCIGAAASGPRIGTLPRDLVSARPHFRRWAFLAAKTFLLY